MPEINLSNITVDPSTFGGQEIVTTQQRVIGVGNMILVIALFIFLAYWYVVVNKNKEKYQNWTNPNGKVINLYKIVRIVFWGYVGVVIVFGLLAILTVPK